MTYNIIMLREREQPTPTFFLDDPAVVDALAKQVHEAATRTIADDPTHWAYTETQGEPITETTPHICVYVHQLAKPLVEAQLAGKGEVEYLEYAESGSTTERATPAYQKFPEQAFLLVKLNESPDKYLLNFVYSASQLPPPKSRLSQLFRTPDPTLKGMVINI